MLSIASSSASQHRNNESGHKHKASDRSMRRFEEVLEQTRESMAQQTCSQSVAGALPDAPDSDFSTSTPSSAAAHWPEPPTAPGRSGLPDSVQTLALRASTGPLAGFMIQVERRACHLHLRLTAPSERQSKRLESHRQNLEEALSQALGMTVTLELGHANN